MESFNEKVKGVLTTEVKFFIVIIGFVVGFVAPFYAMKQDIALINKDISVINSNHEVHIQDIMQQIKDIQNDQLTQNDKLISLQEQIIRLEK